MRMVQEIVKQGNDLIINGVYHYLNDYFCEKVDDKSIHISVDDPETIRLFECDYTVINLETATTADELATLFGLTIQ